MKIETLSVAGFKPALKAMRNPFDSWNKNDSSMCEGYCVVGDADKELSVKLQNAGPEHCKHLRMIVVWADMTLPRYQWQEFDTYRAGVEKVSCSTMHTLMRRPLTADDFEHGVDTLALESVIRAINARMNNYKALKADGKDGEAKEIWREIIQLLPQSFLQTRTVLMSYAALRNIVHQRKGHKLKEWAEFIEWAKSLPNSWMIFE